MTTIQARAVARLSDVELWEEVLRPAPRVAVFDCDGTLWGGDAGLGFMTWSMEAGLLSRDTSDSIDARHRLYRQGRVPEATICGEMVQVYAGLREEELRKAAAKYFAAHVEAQIFQEMRELADELHRAGTEIWAVSSTNNWVIEEGVKRFAISAERVLAAQVRVQDGVITSDLLAVPTDEGKAEALRRAGISAPGAVFGNSIHDEAMLHMALRPIPVNPTPALLEVAAQKRWRVFYPAAVMADHTK